MITVKSVAPELSDRELLKQIPRCYSINPNSGLVGCWHRFGRKHAYVEYVKPACNGSIERSRSKFKKKRWRARLTGLEKPRWFPTLREATEWIESEVPYQAVKNRMDGIV